MAGSAVAFLVENLSLLILNNAKLVVGIRSDVVYVRDELRQMMAFLRVADSKEENDPLLKAWVTQVREIAYDIEDILDIFMIESPEGDVTGVRGYIKSVYDSVFKRLKSSHSISYEIRKIKSRIENASQGYQRYKDIYSSISSQLSNSSYGRGDALLLEDADVVGIENPKKQLFEWICSANYELKVISLVGMGGSGKTTIAKKVFEDESIKEKFDHHVWVTISELYDVEIFLRRMINFLVVEVKQPTPQNLEGMTEDEMKEFLYKFLQHKKYIIVLDDIWKREAWEAIKYAFPKSKTKGCGCIITTTRFATIANAMSGETKGHVFQVEPLPRDEAKQLFFRKAFLGEPCPHHLLTISESILRKCDGLPLAIVVIGGLMATKQQIFSEWEAFNNSLGDEIQDGRMNKIISLSFYDLPYYLKSCFLYLSFFPEDTFLDRWRLIRLWMAESFVQEKPGKTMEEVAQGYLNELVNRNLIQVAQINNGGHPMHYRIHDLVREYILLKSGHEVVVMKNGRDVGLPDRIRRIAFDASFISKLSESYNLGSLRSLLWVGSGDSVSGESISKVLGMGCRLLKELDLRGASITIIPDEVYKLYHLKYLSLRNSKVTQISKSIKHLPNLETLDLKFTSVVDLPVEVLNLQKLRHLLVYKYQPLVDGYYPFDYIQSFNFPYEIGRLSSLQKLVHLITDEVGGIKTVIEIGKLTHLRKLGLINIKKEDGMELCSSLANLTNLLSLNLKSKEEDEVLDLQHSSSSITFPIHTLFLEGRLLKIPEWIKSLIGLTRLILRWSRLRDTEEDPFECLHGLPSLQFLNMDSAYEGEELNFKVGGFQKLKKLHLGRLRKLRRVRVEEGSMPLLQEIYIRNCKMIEDVPEGVQHLCHLQFVNFCDISDDLWNGIIIQKRKGKDFWKLEHVPTVYMGKYVNGKLEGEWLQRPN